MQVDQQLERLGVSRDTPPSAEQWRELYEDLRQRSASELAEERDKLAKSVATYAAILDSAIDGVLVTDEHHRVVRCSQRCLELWNLAGDPAALPTDATERVAAIASRVADPAAFIAVTRQIYEDPRTSARDEILLADGRTLERTSSPIRTEDGKVLGRVWFFRDITEHKRQEDERRRISEERHQFLFEASPLPIWVFDPETLCFLAVNEAMVQLLGYTRDELLRMIVPDVKPPVDVAELQRGMEGLRQGQIHHVGVRPYRRKDGKLVEIDITAHAVMFEGRLVRLAIGVDVTESRRLEERLRQSQKLDAIGQLAGGVAHDFNNILAAILSNAECASEELAGVAPVQALLAEIRLAAERGGRLTRQLLTFSRQQPREPRVLAVNSVVTNIERMLARVVGEDIELTALLQPQLGSVRADQSQLEQVVMNLVLNARDAMPAGGRLVIETSNVQLGESEARPIGLVPGRYVMLAVSDTGSGMDAATRARIFEPFFTTKEVGKGTGLGLATVHGIVKQSEGAIAVCSEPGRGSIFRVYFPRCDETHEPDATQRVVPRAIKGSRILLVEDDQLLRKSLERRLRSWGYTVLTAADPNQALALARDDGESIELLLTDLVMPAMDGRTLASMIRPARPTTKILFMSGYTQHAAIKTMAIDEREHFITKPFSGDELARAIRDALAAEAEPPRAAR